MKNFSVPIALVAGLIGGAFSHYVLSPVQADTNAAPKVVSAQSFALVDAHGKTVGVFTTVKSSTPHMLNTPPAVALFNADGREIWRAGDTTQPIAAAQ